MQSEKGKRFMRRFKQTKKRAFAFLLSFLLMISNFLGGSFGSGEVLVSKVSAAEGTAKAALSKILDQNKIAALDRPASEGLWGMTAGGHRVFCLNSGKSMCSGDTLKYKTINAANYEKEGIAKVLYWYFQESSKNTKALALTQAYIWACGKGASKQNTIYQAGRNVDRGYSQSDAKKFCEKIKGMDPEGTIYYYTVKKCVRGKKHDAHQVLFGFRHSGYPKPEKDSLKLSKDGTASDSVKIKIRKRDAQTRAGLSGATFQIYMDGQYKATVETGSNGEISYTVPRTLSYQVSTEKKTYIKNWNELSKRQQTECTKNGWYMNKASAQTAANKELAQKVSAAIASKKAASKHAWTVKETKAPFGHFLPDQKDQTQYESSNVRSFTYTFHDEFQMVNLKIQKKSTSDDDGCEASLQGAVYGLYAKENIKGSDNKTVVYSADTLVTQIVTNQKGEGSAKNLYPGKYYLKEIKAPLGFRKSEENADLVLDSDQTQTLKEDILSGQIEVAKTFGEEDTIETEAKAVFEIYDSKDQKKDTITTDADGIAKSKILPYGSYRIHQIEGVEGYDFVPDRWVTIDGSEQVYTVKMHDPKLYAGIAITKKTEISDQETNTYISRPEAGATFEIQNKETKEVVETLTTDAYGSAKTGKLDPGTYLIHQIEGADNYAFAKDLEVTITEEDQKLKTYELSNPYDGAKIRIEKKMEKNGNVSAEAGAEFVVLDEALAQDFKTAALSTSEERLAYVKQVKEHTPEAILGTMITDEEGKASMLLSDFTKKSGFILLQTRGVEGYDLANPYYSKEEKPKVEDQTKVYEFSAKDVFSKSARIKIQKKVTTAKGETKAEAGAKFQILDPHGDVVDTLTLDEKGEATSIKLAIGIYTLHQVRGSKQHELLADQDIVLVKSDANKTVSFGPFVDYEKKIEVELTKKSSETKKLLDGAVYKIYDEDGEEVVTLQTGTTSEGKAACELPFGKYTIKEVTPPDGYNADDTEKESFELNLTTVTYDEEGNGSYQIEKTDTPIYGEISLSKTGEVLTGYDPEMESFVYETDTVSGAVYGLYAREDIKKDDGTVVWTKGTLIDKKTTSKEETLKFTRKGADGKETTSFYLGSYFVKEIEAPKGYLLNPESYDIDLTWDIKASQLNEIKGESDVKDSEDPFGNNSPYPSEGIYVLEKGSRFNERIKDAECVTFTWETAPDGVKTTDVSQNKDGSVVLWKEENHFMISTQRAGQVIYFNAVSSAMFRDCKELTQIQFKNVDTSGVVDMSEMFYALENIKELDLSSFNTQNVEDMTRMFYGCSQLKTTYTMDQVLQKEEETFQEEKPVGIEALPKTQFQKGDKFKASDFTWRISYDDDGAQDVEVTDDDVSFAPTYADTAGTWKLNINFASDSAYAEFQTIQTKVKVIDPDEEDVALKNIQKAQVSVTANDFLQKYGIHVKKTDQDGKLLAGATFALKAACDLVNETGEVIVKKGATIATAVSADDQFEYLEFFGLPTDLYASDGAGAKMYTVEEISAPAGYETSEKTLTFQGEILNDDTENFVHDVESEGNENDAMTTYLHDSGTFVNRKSEYIMVKKEWVDHDNLDKKRPESITITATSKTGETKTFVLNEKNGWQMMTDIKKDEYHDYTFSEICESEDYTNVSGKAGEWDKSTYVLSYTNKLKSNPQINLAVKKVWEDGNNADQIRPTSITVTLYRNGKAVTDKKVTLDESNQWTDTTTFKGLDRYDSAGEEIDYEIKEESFSSLTGDEKTGYLAEYETSESTDADGVVTKTFTITNRHTLETTQKTIEKVWKDQQNESGIRPDSVTFELVAKGEVKDTVVLNSENNWKATSKILPAKENGQTIDYQWREVKEGVITGESEIGYKVSYETDAKDSDTTIANNTHKRTQGSGSITITKALDPGNLNMEVGEPTFTFTLSGTDVYGKKYTASKELIFTKEEVEKQMAEHPGEEISLEVTFEDLEYGTYTCKESGEKKYFQMFDLTSDSGNATVNEKEESVTFEIGSDGSTAKAELTGKATFHNQMIQGSVKLKKKDSGGVSLKDVEFTITSSGGAEVATGKTDAKGELIFDGLLPDTYTIRETKTTAGNTLLKEPLEVTLPIRLSQAEVEEQKVDTSNGIKQGDSWYFYHPTYEITNEATMKLPTTGGWNSLKTYLPLIGGFALIVAASLYYFKKKGFML